jgi:hypothetical protein
MNIMQYHINPAHGIREHEVEVFENLQHHPINVSKDSSTRTISPVFASRRV